MSSIGGEAAAADAKRNGARRARTVSREQIAERQRARIMRVEALAAGPAALRYRARELEVLKHMVDAAAGAAPGDRQVSMMSAEAVVASVAGMLHTRMVRGEAPPFMNLLSPMVEVALVPYLDAQTVAREVERARGLAEALAEERSAQPPTPPAGVAIPNGLANPRAHRARLCLLHLADSPGASNRAVAEAIGAPDFIEMAGSVVVPVAKRGTPWDEVLRQTRRARAETRR
ncbi:MAG: hypothetical protein ACHQE6_01760 [Solirubrobacterales bacterium]